MTAARWAEVKSILAGVLEAAPTDRIATLDRLCGGDTELRRNVESLLAHESEAEVLDAGPRIDAGLPPQSIGPYRILREIGRGGMGVVYLGERDDGEYRKLVAIKLITSFFRDPDLERRFRRERQIHAQLEHPGIARLLDGAATAEGQPYFIMEYVEGLPLLTHCEERGLDITARLALFVAVCDAVSHAHQRLVVHRDLKPGNILVTRDGTPKLLDFGLARVMGEASIEAAPTVIALTPAYASPEQIRGEPDTVAGDVYSLGVIFYELISGRRPYRAATALPDLARAIAEEDPTPLPEAVDPRLRRRVSGDLAVIAGKALEKDPRRRYAAVSDFAEDVRRHLDGRPVLARPATWRYRAGKLLRRHRIAIPAAAVALLLIVGFGVAAFWEARRAQRRFEEVRRLAHSVLFELHDAIERLPGSTAARELLIRRALEYLENLYREAGRNAAVAREVALGYERVGIVQGNAGDSNLGHVAASLESFRRADDILGGLLDRAPGNAGLRADRLRVANELAAAFSRNGRLDRAVEILRRNIAAYEEAAGRDPRNPTWIEGIAAAEGDMADVLVDQKRYADAIPPRERVFESYRKLAAAAPGNEESERAVAIAGKRLGALYGVTGRYDECRRAYEAAREIDERRLARHPSEPRVKLDLSYDYSDLGWLEGRFHRWEAALAAYRRTLALRTEVAHADPNDQRAAAGVAGAVTKIGLTYQKSGDLTSALAEFERAAALYRAMIDAGRYDWTDQRELAEVHTDLAEVFEARKSARAAAEYHEARRLYIDLRDRGLLPKSYLVEIDKLAAKEASARAVR